jgi:HK97 family phage major capsid protein
MNLKEQIAALVKAMQDIVNTAKADGDRDLTADESATISAKAAEADTLRARLTAAEKASADLARVTEGQKGDDVAGKAADTDDLDQVPLGERFVKSAAYKAFKGATGESAPGNGTPINIGTVRIGDMKDFFANRKALTSPQARIANIRVGMVDQVERPTLTLLDLVSRGQTGGNFEYVQVVSVTRRAAIVPEATSATDAAALKPVSELATSIADAKVYTYADGYEVTNQLLADAPAFSTYMDQELRYSLDAVVADKLLKGSGVNGEPKGLLNTTGVQEVTYTGTGPKDLIRAVRRGITKVLRLNGGTVQAILINPEDEEAIDLMEDANERFYGGGPFGTGPQTLWGRPRIVSEQIDPGQFILGDFKQIALLDREGLSVQAFNQHADFARRNMTYVRAELRAAQVIWKPSRLVVGDRGAVNA